MKILHIVPTYAPAYRYGGPIISVHTLNKWLVKKGMEVTVYTTNIDGPKDLDVPLGKPVIMDGVKIFYFKSSFPRGWFYSSALRRALKENMRNFDLVHITSVFLAASTLGACYAKKFGKPYIISPRGSLMKEPIRRKSLLSWLKKLIYLWLVEKRNLRNAAMIHFTSEAEKKEYLAQKLSLQKAIIIPNAFDSDEFKGGEKVEKGDFRKKFNIDADKKIVLFFGRISWKKGFDTLIPAFAEVLKKEPSAVLVIAGSDDEGYKKNVELLITNYQLQEKVIFTGMLLGNDKISAFKDAQVFVLPSYSENFGMSVLEALYFGVPVLISEEVALNEVVKRAGAGFVIKKDIAAVATAIEKCFGRGENVSGMIRNGAKLLEDQFSAEVIARQFISSYEDLKHEV